MLWSLSEFLNLVLTRGQCWGVVEVGANAGFRIRPTETVMFYAMLEGCVTISGASSEPFVLRRGETAIVVSGAGHALRVSPECQLFQIGFLDEDEYGDLPHHVSLGGSPAARILCGRLKIRWPGGVEPRSMPPLITIAARDQIIDLHHLVEKARGEGAAALLTRAAALSLIEGLRDHSQCRAIFRDSNFRDPISRAIQYMDLHMHGEWTVADLATKVGMARSTFASRFLAEVGKAPMAVFTDLRMERAAGMISKTQLKLPEIGERVGYRSLSAFSRRFEAHFGMTPGKMRAATKGSPTRNETGQCSLPKVVQRRADRVRSESAEFPDDLHGNLEH